MDYDVIDVKYIHLTEILDSKKRSRLTARLYLVLCNQCYEQLEVTLQVVLWHETFVNTLKAVQIYFIDKFL